MLTYLFSARAHLSAGAAATAETVPPTDGGPGEVQYQGFEEHGGIWFQDKNGNGGILHLDKNKKSVSINKEYSGHGMLFSCRCVQNSASIWEKIFG